MIGTMRQNPIRLATLVVTLLSVISAGVPRALAGRPYDGLDIKQAHRQTASRIKRVLRSDSLEANQPRFDEFFREYALARIVPRQPDVDVGKARAELRTYIDIADNQQALDRLNTLAMEEMTKAVEGNYHPAARYNAVLVIGMLDQRHADRSSPPVPLPAATEYLLSILEGQRDVFDAARIHDALTTGAIVGMERHAKYGLSDDHRTRLTQALLPLVKQEEPPAGRDEQAHLWMRVAAARTLAELKTTGDGNEVVEALRAMMNDKKLPLTTRCRIAAALGKMNYDGQSAQVATELIAEMGALTLTALQKNIEDGGQKINEGISGGVIARRASPRMGMGMELGAMGGIEDEGGLGAYGRSGARGGRPGGAARTARSARGARSPMTTRGGRPGTRNPRTNGRDEAAQPPREPVLTVFPRRQLATQLTLIRDGLGNERTRGDEQPSGPRIAATDEAKETATQIDKQANEAVKILADEYKEDLDLLKELYDIRANLETTIGQPAADEPTPKSKEAGDEDQFGAEPPAKTQ